MKFIAFIIILAGIGVSYLVIRRISNTIKGMRSKRYPIFFYKNVSVDQIGIPVFTYHSIADASTPDAVTIEGFESHLKYLRSNRYHTLTADELYDHLVHHKNVPKKSVVLTFDDGRATFWTIAYPLLQKYNYKAICFLVPNTITDKPVRKNLLDYKAGNQVSLKELLQADLSDTPTITWGEARIMQKSDLVDFQSHTLDHSLIFTSPEIVDFIHPGYDFGFCNYELPLIASADNDRIRHPALGIPLYRSKSRMSAAKRFFDDEQLRNACVRYVADQGGEQFFDRTGWRSKLFRFVNHYCQENTLSQRFETDEEHLSAITYSLEQSKKIIEEQLPSHSVRHLCYPWHQYSINAACQAKKSGYISAFIDINPQKSASIWNDPYSVQAALPINETGDDPYQITRIDARSNTMLSLPGQGRLTYRRRYLSKLFRMPRLLR